MHGILLVDKPEGCSSFDVVRVLRARVKPAKVGHTGTLDPMASGLMIILMGAATRSLDFLEEARKRYHMWVLLGEETDTGDREGNVVSSADVSCVTLDKIEAAIRKFTGVQDQVPPHFSAIKKEGTPLYKLARKGIFPELAPRRVEIYSLKVLKWNTPVLELDLVCSKGTYARSLARDIGRDLGVGGRLEGLRRLASGNFSIENARALYEFQSMDRHEISKRLVPLSHSLAHIPDIEASDGEIRKLMQGNKLTLPNSRLIESSCNRLNMFKIESEDKKTVVIVKPMLKGSEIIIHPIKVFNMER